jgi:GDP-4-dehydro-6-deoxy-D-mannose reductase
MLPARMDDFGRNNLRVLITGIGGFVGGHLSRHILNIIPQVEIHGTILPGSTEPPFDDCLYHAIDLRNEAEAYKLISAIQPDHIYHLAAQASVKRSFENPWQTLENNILSQLNVINACLTANIQPRILIISSGEIYGAIPPEALPIREDTPLAPSSPYSVSKVAQDMLGLQYFLSHHLPIMRARPFNHLGPGQSEGFVAPDFAMQIARIEAGEQQPLLRVGDLSAQRDFTDVRDIVRAYQLIIAKGKPGDVYNVASGKAHSIQYLLESLLKHSAVPIEIQVDQSRMRPSHIPILLGDSTQLRQATGWEATIPFEQTLLDVLNDCRQRIHQSI